MDYDFSVIKLLQSGEELFDVVKQTFSMYLTIIWFECGSLFKCLNENLVHYTLAYAKPTKRSTLEKRVEILK